MQILWTKHAEDRQKEWEKRLGITKEEVESLIRNPEQIVPGDLSVLVAQSRSRGSGTLCLSCIKRCKENRYGILDE